MKKLHPSTEHLYRWLQANPRLPAPGKFVAQSFQALASELIANTPEGPELSAALRKLLEAKDCAVRAVLPPPELPGERDTEIPPDSEDPIALAGRLGRDERYQEAVKNGMPPSGRFA